MLSIGGQIEVMYNHAPDNYKCPICLGVKGIENSDTMIHPSDIVYKDELVTVFIGSIWVGSKNPGHPLIVPNEHYENIYDIPQEVGHRIIDVAKKVALGLKEVRKCEGVTFLQNNEPASNQHAFHYHLHVFTRFEDDELHANMKISYRPTLEERKPYADELKYFLDPGNNDEEKNMTQQDSIKEAKDSGKNPMHDNVMSLASAVESGRYQNGTIIFPDYTTAFIHSGYAKTDGRGDVEVVFEYTHNGQRKSGRRNIGNLLGRVYNNGTWVSIDRDGWVLVQSTNL